MSGAVKILRSIHTTIDSLHVTAELQRLNDRLPRALKRVAETSTMAGVRMIRPRSRLPACGCT
eukprot:5872429-Amphidinium_carterae.1